jgi:hypothetical protein
MHLISFGCSLILGTDLSDDGRYGPWSRASKLSWPALLADQFQMEYACRAKGGSGNLCILDRVLQLACMFKDTIFVIGWTYIDRFDYSHPKGRHFAGSADDYLTLRPAEENDLEKIYYRQLHSEYKDKFTSLIYIKTAIDFLEKLQVPFVMTCVDDTLFDKRWHASPAVLELQQMVKPYISDFEGRNFVDWSRHRGFDISATGHPLEEAHAAAADLMAPVIDAILRKA